MNRPGISETDRATPDSAWSDRGLFILFLVVASVSLWILTRSWNASILDRYEFRQIQTALSAFWMQREGFQLSYLTPLFGPPWSIPMEFPTYQGCVAVWSSLTGMPIEQSGRLMSVLFFAATLPALFDLSGIAGVWRRSRWIVLAMALTTPVYLFYARTVMIETAALCFSVWFLAFLRRALEKPRAGIALLASFAAVAAALTKITTFAVFCVPGGIMTAVALGASLRSTEPRKHSLLRALAAALPVLIALAIAVGWIRYSDALKHSNPFTGFLASTELTEWNYGRAGLRAEPGFWLRLWENTSGHILPEASLVVVAIAAALASPRARWTALATLPGYLFGPLVFANLYHIHDYYYSANALLLTAGAGLLVASAWENMRSAAGMRWTMLIALLACQLVAYTRSYHHYHRNDTRPAPDLPLIVREATPQDSVILIFGDDWNPETAYFAQRRAVMVPGRRENETEVLELVLAKMPDATISAMVVAGNELRENTAFIRERAARFGFSPEPFARSERADLYLAESLAQPAAIKLASRTYPSASLLVQRAEAHPHDGLNEQPLKADDFPMAQPAPTFARSKFGVSAGDAEGRPVINAHAPSEVFFDVPHGATHIAASVVLPAAAYADSGAAATDGIVIDVFEESAGNLRRSLYHRVLDPAKTPADRGWQEIRIQRDRPFTGRIVFKIGPGDSGNITNDWAAWSRIEIK